jgi:hypothetical protein
MKDGRVEKVVVNARPYRGGGVKEEKAVPTVSGELAKLSQANPSLGETELKDLLIMRSVFMPYNIDMEHQITAAIERYIKKEIDIDKLVHELDTKHGGAGLYAPKAVQSAKEIERLFKEMEAVGTKDPSRSVSDPAVARLRARSAADYLLEQYQGKVSPEQKRAIVMHIEERFAGKSDGEGLKKALSQAISAGGAGLHVRTADHFSEEIETLLAK